MVNTQLNPRSIFMALQFKRYPRSLRTTFVPQEGEPVYDLTEKRLYVGDGETTGGVGVSGSDDFTIKTIVADMLSSGVQQNIRFTPNVETGKIDTVVLSPLSADFSPTLSGNLNLNGRAILGDGNILINGYISSAAYVGSVFADDSTVMIDANTGTHYGEFNGTLYGEFSGSLKSPLNVNNHGIVGFGHINLAGTQSVFSSETPSAKVLSVAKHTSSVNAGANLHLRRSRGTSVNPVEVQTGDIISSTISEAFDGSGYTQSSMILSRANGAISPGVVPGSLEFYTADPIGFLNRRMTIDSNGRLFINGQTTVTINESIPAMVSIRQFHGEQDSNNFVFVRGRGTATSPLPVQVGDDVADITFAAFDGTNTVGIGGISSIVAGLPVNGNIPSRLSFSINTGANILEVLTIRENSVIEYRCPTLLPAQMPSTNPSVYMSVIINGKQYAIPAVEITNT